MSFYKTAAQNNSKEDSLVPSYKKIVLMGEVIDLPLYDIHNSNAYRNSILSDTTQIDYYKEHWNTNFFKMNWDEYAHYPLEIHFNEETFSPPVAKKMVITSRYGWRHGRAHQGIDIDLESGDDVLAILDGKIRYAKNQRGYGRTIVIRHKNGLETVYAHLSAFNVEENEIVKKGQIIGRGGVSGNARGSHLHLEVHYQGKAVHPEYIFEFDRTSKIRSDKIVITEKWTTPRLHKSTIQSDIKLYHASNDNNEDKKDSSTDQVYVVKKGDTLYKIASDHHIKISDLCKKNEIDDTSILNVGQKILLF